MFKGSITALITPFRDGAIDWAAFDALIEWQIDQGTHGLVACGTTGESPTLEKDEHYAILERTVAVVKKRIPVIAGTGSNSTATAIQTTRYAEQIGADAALIVTPYYNKPTQDGLYAHFKAVHDATDIPIILYNIPGRCVVDMTNDTIARLAELPRIIGVKDATGNLERPALLRDRLGPDFLQFSGDDGTALAFLAAGGHGCISVASNIAPALCAAAQDAWAAGHLDKARALFDRMIQLNKALFSETSPAPVKYAASKMGLCRDEVRLPLVAASPAARAAMDAAMAHTGIGAGDVNPQRSKATG